MKKFIFFSFLFLSLVCSVACTTFRAHIGELKDGEIEISKDAHTFVGVML